MIMAITGAALATMAVAALFAFIVIPTVKRKTDDQQ